MKAAPPRASHPLVRHTTPRQWQAPANAFSYINSIWPCNSINLQRNKKKTYVSTGSRNTRCNSRISFHIAVSITPNHLRVSDYKNIIKNCRFKAWSKLLTNRWHFDRLLIRLGQGMTIAKQISTRPLCSSHRISIGQSLQGSIKRSQLNELKPFRRCFFSRLPDAITNMI